MTPMAMGCHSPSRCSLINFLHINLHLGLSQELEIVLNLISHLDANSNHQLAKMAKIKILTIQVIGEGQQLWECKLIQVPRQTGIITRVKNTDTLWAINSTLGYISK